MGSTALHSTSVQHPSGCRRRSPWKRPSLRHGGRSPAKIDPNPKLNTKTQTQPDSLIELKGLGVGSMLGADLTIFSRGRWPLLTTARAEQPTSWRQSNWSTGKSNQLGGIPEMKPTRWWRTWGWQRIAFSLIVNMGFWGFDIISVEWKGRP